MSKQTVGDAPIDDSSADSSAEPFAEPIDDDLDKRIAAAAPRRLTNRASYVLLAMVIAVAGFVGGAQVQKHYGTSTAASDSSTGGTNPNAAGGQFPGGAGRASGAPGAQGQPAGGGRGGAITGTVKLVDGTTVYIETPDGQTITVKTNGDTTVLAPGTLADIAVGSTVSVQGQNTDGTVTATSVTRAQ